MCCGNDIEFIGEEFRENRCGCRRRFCEGRGFGRIDIVIDDDDCDCDCGCRRRRRGCGICDIFGLGHRRGRCC